MSVLCRNRVPSRIAAMYLAAALAAAVALAAASCAAAPRPTAARVADVGPAVDEPAAEPAPTLPAPAIAAESAPEKPGSGAAKSARTAEAAAAADLGRGEGDDGMSGVIEEKRDYELAAPAPSAAAAASSTAPSTAAAEAPAQSGLKAGYADDNKQFNYFTDFLAKYAEVPHYELGIQERILIQVRDSEDRPVANAAVTVKSGGAAIARGLTYADGGYSLYPLEMGKGSELSYSVEASAAGAGAKAEVDRAGPRSITLRLASGRKVPDPLPVDVLFVLDTTGSMGEEIERLRATIEIIDANISALKPRPELRFGMVLYKDRRDEYVTRVVPFTDDLGKFRKALDEVYAEGGGDDPEDLQSALDKAIRGMRWNSGGIRLGFVITDAAAHLDYGQSYDYAEAARDAREKGIKLFSIGVGGLPLEGEYVLRQIAQFTQGRYIFLTYGEKGESEGGREAAVSHHTGSNWSADKLESIVIRFVKEEIALQGDRPLAQDEEYYSAIKTEDGKAEDILGELFAEALGDLSDYSGMRIGKETRCAIMPVAVGAAAGSGAGATAAAQAEYFGSALAMAAAESGLFTLVERKDLQEILAELELQLSGLADEESAAKVGRLLGAEVLVAGTLFEKDGGYELFLKLLRVETAEVLSAAKARIGRELGL